MHIFRKFQMPKILILYNWYDKLIITFVTDGLNYRCDFTMAFNILLYRKVLYTVKANSVIAWE